MFSVSAAVRGAVLKYRKEIDGLRAFAVLPVILAHAKFEFFGGGYIGVDIFFVISGFLISSIIYSEVREGRFSIVRFYERRARRIIPALILIILVSLVPAHFLMLPDPYENFGQSIVATLLFSNNILLTLTSGYWEIASDFKPLLHTWSLGVEEQFYIFYPLIVMLVLKFSRRAFPSLLLIGVLISLSLSIWLTPRYPNASFYLLHTRAWELLLGALAAHYLSQHKPAEDEALSLLGFAAIIVSVIGFPENIPYPYFYAVLPCVGTALILIYGRSGTMVARLLSWKIFVGIGLVSYSAYLWHQPVFAFARTVSIKEPPASLYGVLSGVTMVLAYLSWRYVEQPFRNRSTLSRGQILFFSATSSAMLVCVGFSIYCFNGLPDRIPGIGLDQERYIAYNERVFQYKKDTFSGPQPHKLLILGNSTGRDFVNIILESGLFSNYDIVYRDDIDMCGPFSGKAHLNLIEQADAIVEAANWTYRSNCAHMAVDDPCLAGKALAFIGPKHFGYNLDAYMHTPVAERPKVRATLLPDTREANEQFRNLVSASIYVDLLGMFDHRYGGIPVFDEDGHILSADRVHLTRAGAKFFARIVFDHPVWRSFAITPPPHG